MSLLRLSQSLDNSRLYLEYSDFLIYYVALQQLPSEQDPTSNLMNISSQTRVYLLVAPLVLIFIWWLSSTTMTQRQLTSQPSYNANLMFTAVHGYFMQDDLATNATDFDYVRIRP